MTAIKAALIDADGTLFDSNRLHYLAYKSVVQELYNYPLSWTLFRRKALSGSTTGLELLKELGIEVDKERFYKLKDRKYVELIRTQLTLIPGAKHFLEQAKAKHIKCYIVSDGKKIPIQAAMKSLGIVELIEDVITAENCPELKKPEPYLYKKALESAAVDSVDAIAIEDTEAGIVSAKANGLWCAAIKHGANKLSSLAKSDLIVKNYQELEEHLF